MNITLNLSPIAEKKLRDQACQKGQSVDDLLAWLTQKWLAGEDCYGGSSKSAAEKVQEWRSWVASHQPATTIADDSRESIYAGRGE